MNCRADIDLILPCYNPPSGWEQKVIRKFKEIQSLFNPVNFHLLIVSDGSKRGYEPEVVAALKNGIPGVQVIDYRPNRGKGYALREAVRHCQSEYIIYTDYDFPYTDSSFRQVINTLLNKADSKDSTAQAKRFFYQQKLIASCLILSSYTRLNGKK